MSAEITVLVVTSPTDSDPAPAILTATLDSIRVQLPDAPILVGGDGVRDEQAHLTGRYEEKVTAVARQTARWAPIEFYRLIRFGHQANVTRLLLSYVDTPLVLFVEHDTPLTGLIDWENCAAVVAAGAVESIRFHYGTAIDPEHLHMMHAGGDPAIVGGVPLVRTWQWSQRPHLARADWYRGILARYFAPESRTYIEEVMHGVAQHERRNLAIYAPPGNYLRSLDSDGRKGGPTFPCRFAYPGGVAPPGAPQPSR